MNEKMNVDGRGSFPTRRQVIAAVGMAIGGVALGSSRSWAGAEEEISHTTEAKQFDKVIQLSAAVKSGQAKAPNPPEISREAGGAFALFGGYIFGRQLELVPNERIVQAWRVGSWDPGIFSIARFELVEQGTGTKIVFDHTGFPKGDGEHLAQGWKMNYWEPMEKFLA